MPQQWSAPAQPVVNRADNTNPRGTPDRSAALVQYRRRAGLYDLELAPFEPIRRRAIDQLGLQPGETVLDVGCGTGLSLPLLASKVGASGRIVGIEQSPEMMALARQRAGRMGCGNVELICSPVEEAELPMAAEAALLHFTHDILRRPEAVDALVGHLRPGARLIAAGLKWAQPWASPANLFVWSAALRSVTSIEGLDAPWSLLAERSRDLNVETMLLGGVYIARMEIAG